MMFSVGHSTLWQIWLQFLCVLKPLNLQPVLYTHLFLSCFQFTDFQFLPVASHYICVLMILFQWSDLITHKDSWWTWEKIRAFYSERGIEVQDFMLAAAVGTPGVPGMMQMMPESCSTNWRSAQGPKGKTHVCGEWHSKSNLILSDILIRLTSHIKSK